MREVLRNPYFLIVVDEEAQLVRLTRLGEPFPDASEVSRRWLEVTSALDRAGRSGRGLYTDLRLGPARNDPAFEQAVRAVLPLIHRGFVCNAVLVKLAVGALQIRRHAREDGIDRLVSDSPEEAERYLRERLSAVASSRSRR
jgi:hypothetical protein